MRLRLTRDAREFVARAEPFLAERIEHNILATVAASAAEHGHPGLFAYAVDDAGGVAYAALRTPPWPLLCTELDRSLADEFVTAWLAQDPELAAVSALTATARAIAGAWSRATGGTARLAMSEAIHVLGAVREPPRPASGRLRLPTAGERELLLAWLLAFDLDVRAGGGGDPEPILNERLARDGLFLWDDGGPVSLVGYSPAVRGVVRVAPVYTPPEHRGHGYASSAVAAISRRALAAGAERCMLYTDLANATSNKIYADVGYVRVADWEEHRLA